jgi:lactate permease
LKPLSNPGTVWWHSIAGASVIGLIALLQAYVFPWMIPALPVVAK